MAAAALLLMLLGVASAEAPVLAVGSPPAVAHAVVGAGEARLQAAVGGHPAVGHAVIGGGGAEAPLLAVGTNDDDGAQAGALRRQLVDPWPPAAHAVVAVGGCSGGGAPCYSTIRGALEAAPSVVEDERKRYVIQLKAGEYLESVTITRKNVVLLGEGADKTVITASKSNATGYLTNETATINAFGNGFLAQDLTIRNAAGPKGNQAVALRSNSNHSVVYRCRIEGYQDTLWAENERQLYLESNISGTVDLVFGNAKAFFQKCRIQVRRPLDQGGQRKHNVITAQGRNNPNATDSGFVFHECYVEAAPGDDLNGVDTFLGRPYKQYSHVAFVNSYLSGVVNALGWVHWDRSQEVNKTTVTVGYYEFGNQGPGADTSRRVHWDGLHIDLTTAAAASTFTADAFIGASHWVPKQIHYEHGLGAAPPPPPLVHAGRAA